MIQNNEHLLPHSPWVRNSEAIWPMVSHELQARGWPGLSSWKSFPGAGRPASKLTYAAVSGRSHFLPGRWLRPQCIHKSCVHDVMAGFSEWMIQENRQETVVPFMTWSPKLNISTSAVFVGNESLSSDYSWGRDLGSLWRKEHEGICGHFKTTTCAYLDTFSFCPF